jgi:hypothetical protein
MALTFERDIPQDVPTTLPVYQLGAPLLKAEALTDLTRIAARLGLPSLSGETLLSEDFAVLRQGQRVLQRHTRSGAFVYRDEERHGGRSDVEYALDDERSVSIAQSFLDRLAVLPSGEAVLSAVTHLRTAGGAGDGSALQAERLLDAGVVYSRVVDGIPVQGPGGSAMVTVDPKGEVTGVRAVWRPLGARVGTVGIVPPETLRAELEQTAKDVLGDMVVTDVRFGYFELGLADAQRFLQPAYAAIYELRNGDVRSKHVRVMAAGDKTHEPVVIPKQFSGAGQPPRAGIPVG